MNWLVGHGRRWLSWWFSGAVLALLPACENGSSGDTGSDASADDGCLVPGVGEDGPGLAPCCGTPCCGDPCCGGDYCGEEGWYCTVDADCGPGMICQEGVCIMGEQDTLPECDDAPARVELAFGAGVQTQPGALAIIDHDMDERDDLAIARADGTLVVWIEAGGGTFDEVGPFTSSAFGRPRDMDVADLNDDGLLDLALVGDQQPGQLSLMFADETGMYTVQPPVVAGAHPTAIAIDDFDTDGVQDVALMTSEVPDVSVINVLYGDGEGGFLVPLDITLALPPLDFAVAHLDDNQIPDLVVANADGVALLRGRRSGGFEPLAQLTAMPGATTAAVAVDGAFIVRAAGLAAVGEVATWRWRGDADATMPTASYSLMRPLGTVLLGDLDDDGARDAIAGTVEVDPLAPTGEPGAIVALYGDGSGAFACQTSYTLAKHPVDLVAGDIDGDRMLDLAAASGVDTVSVLLSK